jgi:hypothetical protein
VENVFELGKFLNEHTHSTVRESEMTFMKSFNEKNFRMGINGNHRQQHVNMNVTTICQLSVVLYELIPADADDDGDGKL